jgi:hypothetical protein
LFTYYVLCIDTQLPQSMFLLSRGHVLVVNYSFGIVIHEFYLCHGCGLSQVAQVFYIFGIVLSVHVVVVHTVLLSTHILFLSYSAVRIERVLLGVPRDKLFFVL